METKHVTFVDSENKTYNYELFYEKNDKSFWDRYGLFVVSFVAICVYFTIIFILLKTYF